MALTVNTNVASLNALTHLSRNTRSMSSTLERISSGHRIARAADDAAGLGVAENLETMERSSRQAMRNTNDGISLIHTAESATNEISNLVKRMRELAVQSASETMATTERQYIVAEQQALMVEVDRIAINTEFNGIHLLDGTVTTLNVQVGANAGSNNQIDLQLGASLAPALGLDLVILADPGSAQLSLTTLDSALDTLNGYRAEYGATENRLDSALNTLGSYTENLAAAQSQIRDADYAYETAQLAKEQVIHQAGLSVLAQANSMASSVMSLL